MPSCRVVTAGTIVMGRCNAVNRCNRTTSSSAVPVAFNKYPLFAPQRIPLQTVTTNTFAAVCFCCCAFAIVLSHSQMSTPSTGKKVFSYPPFWGGGKSLYLGFDCTKIRSSIFLRGFNRLTVVLNDPPPYACTCRTFIRLLTTAVVNVPFSATAHTCITARSDAESKNSNHHHQSFSTFFSNCETIIISHC